MGIADNLAFVWDGTAWRDDTGAPASAGSGIAGIGGFFNSLSCPTSHFCAGVTGEGQIAMWDGTKWTVDDGVLSPAYTASISCTSAVTCLAVGTGALAAGWYGTQYRYWNASSWSEPSEVPTPGTMDIPGYSPPIVNVQCAAPGSCMLLDGGKGYSFRTPPKSTSTG